ncbi:MAG: hypothetical protein P8J68_10615 [Arenicellaceae bacterium]|nr:hypothetical protein [Arenicellaceae bacterium]
MFTKLTDPDKRLRIRYWNCGENQNNDTYTMEEGTAQSSGFTFTTQDDQDEGDNKGGTTNDSCKNAND